MDHNLRDLSDLSNGISCDDSYSHPYATTHRHGLDELQAVVDNALVPCMTGDPNPEVNPASSIPTRTARDSPEYCEITSDAALNYISWMLLEEEIDEKASVYQEEAAIRATEKHFYDILGQKYPPSPDRPPLYSGQSSTCSHDSSSSSDGGLVDNIQAHHVAYCSNSIDFSSQPLLGPSYSVGNNLESCREPLISEDLLPVSHVGSLPTLRFRGVEEAKRFFPCVDKLVIDFEANAIILPSMPKNDSLLVEVNTEKEEDEKEHLIYGSRGRKNPYDEDLDLLEGRNNKQSAICSDDPVRNEMFDEVLVRFGEKHMEDAIQLRELMENEANKNSQNVEGGKRRGKKQIMEEVVDLSTLLIQCAQAVATDDRRKANRLLKQIREHSLPNGDGSQRLACHLANGLEARLAGTGSQVYQKLAAKRPTALDMLKALYLYLAACPFLKISHYFTNQTILNVVGKASRVHVIDFGIGFGFRWPSLIQRLSKREGGPPKLRITGIDAPRPGFRPSQVVETAGRRLADYAREFNVPFQYQAIASKWETIRVQDINIDKDEVLIICCVYRLKTIADETVAVDSPRDRVLNTIRQMNPSAFILGIVNGAFNAPFFVSRFREVLFYYTAIFDVLDANVPRDNITRLVIEKDIFGREALNVVACEGSERVERPQTYKQWQPRVHKAGLVQLPLNPAITKKIQDKVRAIYHKDFVVDEDGCWLLQGWKGRTLYALSTWKPGKM